MKRIAQTEKYRGKTTILALVGAVVIQITLAGCAATDNIKGSGVVSSREATDIWHSYEILPNYNYYISGPESQPNYIIGIDNKYRLNSKLWRPVDLTPEMLKNWFNYIRPRVGYSVDSYGAFILGPDDERVGLWYSVRDWQLTGAATVGEDNTIAVTLPSEQRGSVGGMKRKSY